MAPETATDPVEGNAFRRVLASEFGAGIFSLIPSEAIVEIIGYAGFDFVVFDTEHGTYDLATIERLARAAAAAGVASVVRIGHPIDTRFLTRILDLGIDGLIFASVSSREDAEAIVESARLPPRGALGPFPFLRAGHYFRMPVDEYKHRLNDMPIIVLIETREGLDNIEAILSVDGIDGVAVGPMDLSEALGVARDGPEVKAAIKQVTKLARARGKCVMAPAKDFDELEGHLKDKDAPRVFWYANDAFHISNHFHMLIEKSDELLARHGGGNDTQSQ